MLTILLKILGIIGILLLVLLGIVLAGILLVLFWPIVYRAHADLPTSIRVKINWLFGLVRVRYFYPDPGNLTIKMLWFTLFDTGGETHSSFRKSSPGKQSHSEKTEEHSEGTLQEVSKEQETFEERNNLEEQKPSEGQKLLEGQETSKDKNPSKDEKASKGEDILRKSDRVVEESKKISISERIATVKDKLQSLWDKLQSLWENITYYKEILLSEDAKGLLAHGLRRLGKILRSIRPRKLRADIILGTGAPDTTGYAFAVYGIFLPHLGKHAILTPDFEEKRLEGEVDIAGHITVFRILWNGLMVIFDRRLRKLASLLKKTPGQQATEKKHKTT